MSKGKIKAPEDGLVFPPDPKRPGERGSTFGNKGAWAAAIGAISPADAEKIQKEKDWRNNYTKYIIKQVEESARSPQKAIAVAKGGLDYCYNNFEFVREGKVSTLQQALDTYTTPIFKTGFIKGTGEKPKGGYVLKVPYKGKELSGDALLAQLDRWYSYGTIEKTARDYIAEVVKNQQWLDLSDKYFCLLGAGSAMGPFLTLMALGANIIAIDLNRAPIWKRLISVARNSPGTITFPLLGDQDKMSDEELFEKAGCNLFTQTPEIRTWVLSVYPDKHITVGAYAYLDGELHVKVSLAMDAIIRDMTTKRKAGAAYLCTPTDVHVITSDAAKAERDNYSSFGVATLFKYLPGMPPNFRKPVKTDDGKKEINYVNGIVDRQGPNYALAKRIQHWRAMVARTEGSIVSSNIAPSTSTASVTHNRLFAWAYGGMHHFKPMEVFAPETSNAVMAALLINDVRNPNSVAHPSVTLDNPLELFREGSFHGGVWRTAFPVNAIGTPSAIVYLATQPAVIAGLGVWAAWIGFLVVTAPK
ncbi:hypothetical protein M427DRAFT_135548 [Gonapodya prolifera JEL478]|uniref:Uncharacterized protein n=1 Tax=Gonapodya prolifera (strain JEL478) TaxID=1344416 RepID=A0A139AEM4_GONPJ|nr:hypothetical protein M427DRAFT_135548 [Gonapodya prolifera JEL478]|eukprot:KXS14873.1 hypothetical protein M427DRAFT_135548 [Gonapodya prolifera JEL478]